MGLGAKRFDTDHQEAGNPVMHAPYRFDSLGQWVGRELGVSDWILITQEQIDLFADCTGDRQWMHVDRERCRRESPYGAPVAHGFLMLSVLAKLVADLGGIPEDFKTPVLAGARVRASARIAAVAVLNEAQRLVTAAIELQAEGAATPAVTADLMVLMFR
jgi:acyl dehydratase